MFHSLESSACQRSMPTLPASVLRFTHDYNSKKDVGDLKHSSTLTDMRVAVSIIPEQYSSTSVYPWETWEFIGIKIILGYFPVNSFNSDHSYKPDITSSSQDSAQEVALYCPGNYYLRVQKKIKGNIKFHGIHILGTHLFMHYNRWNLCQAKEQWQPLFQIYVGSVVYSCYKLKHLFFRATVFRV